MNKAELRKEMERRNAALTVSERRGIDGAIYERLTVLSEYADAKLAFVYVGVGHEVSTDAIMRDLFSRGVRVCVPLCYGKGVMDAIEISSESDLVAGRYNIPEPKNRERVIEPSELDIIIVPGVAFGEDGSRLGRGGGYYDRFLDRAKKAKRIALCREINTEKTVPREEHDEYVDVVVTECRVIKPIR